MTREIFEPEAAVVREIFERYVAGQGLKKIADALKRKNTPTPRPRKLKGHDRVVRPVRNRGDWRPTNVRSILLQPLYRGIARWNRLKQHDEKGNPILAVNAESEHVTKFNPEWQIVASVSETVDARFADENRKKFAPSTGTPVRNTSAAARIMGANARVRSGTKALPGVVSAVERPLRNTRVSDAASVEESAATE